LLKWTLKLRLPQTFLTPFSI